MLNEYIKKIVKNNIVVFVERMTLFINRSNNEKITFDFTYHHTSYSIAYIVKFIQTMFVCYFFFFIVFILFVLLVIKYIIIRFLVYYKRHIHLRTKISELHRKFYVHSFAIHHQHMATKSMCNSILDFVKWLLIFMSHRKLIWWNRTLTAMTTTETN